MSIRTRTAIAAICLLAASGAVWSQSPSNNDVTFRIPVNLTRLSPDLVSVVVSCVITSSRIPNTKAAYGGVTLPVANGQVQTTAMVVVAVPPLNYDSYGGGSAGYECELFAVDKVSHVVHFQANGQEPASRVSPTPGKLTGSFMWETPAQP